MTVKIQKQIEFINDCGCYVDKNDLAKAIYWYSKKPVARLKHIYMHGNYPAVSIHDKKIHVHRLLMMYWENRILNKNEAVHHLDGNKLKSTKDNLKIIQSNIHGKYHNIGKIITEQQRIKISQANHKRMGIKMKKRANVPLDELKKLINAKWSINKIAKHFNVAWSTIRDRIYENPELLNQLKQIVNRGDGVANNTGVSTPKQLHT